MKRFITPILVLVGFFLIFLWLLSTRGTTMDITISGAGYVTFLLAIYLLIPSVGNPGYYRMWWPMPEDVTPKQRWGFSVGNFLLCMTVCWASLDLPRESLPTFP